MQKENENAAAFEPIVILLCPFCNSRAEVSEACAAGSSYQFQEADNGAAYVISNWKFYKIKFVSCLNCGISKSGEGHTEKQATEQAIKNWNRRTK